MKPEDLESNRAAWDTKTPFHTKSPFYDVEGFRAGQTSLNKLDMELAGDVRGKRLLHLQCHFGLDTLSFARQGAKVTGLDFSPVAIETANALATEIDVDATFVCADVHAAPKALGGAEFDVVFTSYGALPWVPSMEAWADAAVPCVAKGGKIVVIEFHPFVWVWDDAFTKLQYPWDSAGVVIEEDEKGTYADRDADISTVTRSWNHSLGALVTALATRGMKVERLVETTRSPYDVFATGVEDAPGEFYAEALGKDAPLVFGLVATKL